MSSPQIHNFFKHKKLQYRNVKNGHIFLHIVKLNLFHYLIGTQETTVSPVPQSIALNKPATSSTKPEYAHYCNDGMTDFTSQECFTEAIAYR